jgi:hypothetical protein
MVAIPLRARLKPDGTLDLRVPTGLPESDVDVLVVVQPAAERVAHWPEGFIDETYGAFADAPLERPPQYGLEARESFH